MSDQQQSAHSPDPFSHLAQLPRASHSHFTLVPASPVSSDMCVSSLMLLAPLLPGRPPHLASLGGLARVSSQMHLEWKLDCSEACAMVSHVHLHTCGRRLPWKPVGARQACAGSKGHRACLVTKKVLTGKEGVSVVPGSRSSLWLELAWAAPGALEQEAWPCVLGCCNLWPLCCFWVPPNMLHLQKLNTTAVPSNYPFSTGLCPGLN